MEELIVITDLDVTGQESDEKIEKYRHASRAVLLDENGLVPILYVAKRDFHKLPGGGVEEGEDLIEALRRECIEEIGCEIEVECEIGQTVETRRKKNLHQTCYSYLGKITNNLGELNFTQEEIDDGYEVKWVPINEAIELLRSDEPTDYNAKFINLRELVILEKANDILVKRMQ